MANKLTIYLFFQKLIHERSWPLLDRLVVSFTQFNIFMHNCPWA
jgi:hypothetical protein